VQAYQALTYERDRTLLAAYQESSRSRNR
jgi:hypothetical protein